MKLLCTQDTILPFQEAPLKALREIEKAILDNDPRHHLMLWIAYTKRYMSRRREGRERERERGRELKVGQWACAAVPEKAQKGSGSVLQYVRTLKKEKPHGFPLADISEISAA